MSIEATEVQPLDRFECLACGYVYEPEKTGGGSQSGAKVLFEDLPTTWRCPVCAAAKSRFTNIGPQGAPSGFKENLSYGLGVNTLTPGQKNLLIFGGLVLGFLFLLSFYGLR
ncbi:MAG: rubredoxin [Cyanobacteria bacterium LVE1205-1]|jgi:rubredoxin